MYSSIDKGCNSYINLTEFYSIHMTVKSPSVRVI